MSPPGELTDMKSRITPSASRARRSASGVPSSFADQRLSSQVTTNLWSGAAYERPLIPALWAVELVLVGVLVAGVESFAEDPESTNEGAPLKSVLVLSRFTLPERESQA